MQDKATGKSRCFGFVTYKDPKILDDVLSKKHTIDQKEIDCKRAIPRDQHSEAGKDGSYRTKKLFVGGLTQTTTEEQFKQYFEQFGTIEDSVIMVDKDTGKSRGFGFITFASEDSVERVIERYHENKIDGKWVECKKAQAKDIMPAGGRKGGKSDSRGQSDHSRHGGRGGGDRSRGQGGYYQTSPTGHSGSRKGPRNQPSQDNYGGNYQGGYGQNYGRANNYGYEGGPTGYGPDYGYGSNPTGYDASYNVRNPAGGYGYGGDYGTGYGANYPYPSQTPYGTGYNTGYPSQYNPSYGQQSYDPLMMAGGNPSASNPAMTTATTTKGTDPTMASMGQMGVNTTGQYSGNMSTGYGTEPYGQAGYGGYNPMQGGYSADANYMAYSNTTQQPGGVDRNAQAGTQGKYGVPGQVQSPSQMTAGYPKQGQSDVGPIKGGAKKPGAESRFYQPY